MCKDPPDASKPIDITSAFPQWVKKALAQQAASGIRFTQPTPESEVGGYAAFDFDLGYGTCHGTSLAIFQIFEELPITSWTKKYGDTPLKTPPKRVPTELGGFPPRERAFNVLEESDKAAVATAHYLKTSKPGGHRWIGFVEVGDRALMKHIQLLGGKKTKVPKFGSWGYANDRDHSAIALGRVGKDRVYVLQKMNPMNPYYINVQPIANYDWHEIPPGKIKAKK